MDKVDFFHNIKRLRPNKLAGQALYPACTKVGQKTACLQEAAFCTSRPVDIQRVFHSEERFKALFGLQNDLFRQLFAGKAVSGRLSSQVEIEVSVDFAISWILGFAERPGVDRTSGGCQDGCLAVVFNAKFGFSVYKAKYVYKGSSNG